MLNVPTHSPINSDFPQLFTRLDSKPLKTSRHIYDKRGNIIASNSREPRIRGTLRGVNNGNALVAHNNTGFQGRRFLLEAISRTLPNSAQQLTLNNILDINGLVTPDNPLTLHNRAICLYGFGCGGSTLTFGQVYDSSINDNNLFEIFPMRVVPVENDLSPTEREEYFMKRIAPAGKYPGGDQYYEYYLKKTTHTGIMTRLDNVNYTPQIEDNTPIELKDANAPLALHNIDVKTNYPIRIAGDDGLEYYRLTAGNLRYARYNEIALFYGLPVTLNVSGGPDTYGEEYTDYIAVEMYSHLTFDNIRLDGSSNDYTFTVSFG
jgi:hypothetical protein